MLFLFSLLIAAAFSVFCGKAIRKHPAPFYLAAAVLSIGTTVLANTRMPEIPAFVQQNVIAAFTKGILAAAFWAVIMWTGALPNGSALMKKLMPQRGQLSIFAAVLTLGHAVGLGISMLPRWLKKADALNLTVCIVLMLIMLPLTVLSVQKVRRKMKAKTWKSIQRWAYLFYALIPVHIIVLNIPKARSGRKDVLLNLMLYLVVFLGYAVCRINKWYQLKKKPGRLIGLKLASWGAFLIGLAIFAAAAFPQEHAETVQSAEAEVHEEAPQNEVTTAAQTSATAVPGSGTVTSSVTDGTESGSTKAETTAASGTEVQEDSEEAGTPEPEQSEQSEHSEPAEEVPQAADPQSARRYQDGTFTAKAYGYDGDITVHVTIQDDKITDITAETEESDNSYFADAQSTVIPAIIRSQAADVDACSGATYSSNGIMSAVRAALESAKQ